MLKSIIPAQSLNTKMFLDVFLETNIKLKVWLILY